MKETMDAVGGSVLVVQGTVGEVAVLAEEGGRGRLRRSQRGMVSAEWAVGIIAAIAIAGVLLTVVTSGPVEKALLGFVLELIRRFAGGL